MKYLYNLNGIHPRILHFISLLVNFYNMKIHNFSLASAFLALTLVVSFLPIMPFTFRAEAANTSFQSPTSAVAPNEWSNPSNALASDNAYATESSDNDEQRYSNFNFSIPSGATINGIEVQLEAFASVSSETLWSDSFGQGSSLSNIPNWDEEGNDDDSTTKVQSVGSGDDTASPDGGRFAFIADDEWICRSISGNGYNPLTVSYYWRGDSDAENGDVGIVEYKTGNSCDNGGSWTTLATHELDDNNVGTTAWSSIQTANLPGLNNFVVRFRNGNQDNSNENFRIDGVSVVGKPQNSACEIETRIGDGSNLSGYKTAVLTDTEALYTLGGAADLWSGVTWSDTDFSNANFKLEVKFDDTSSCDNDALANLDHVQAKVYYTEALPTSGTITVNKVVVGSEADPNSFSLFVGSEPVANGVGEVFGLGTYTVSETSVANFTPTFGGDCDQNGNVTLSVNDTNQTCTVTNTYNPPQPTDVCSNMDGIQTTLPEGYHYEGEGVCEEDEPEPLVCEPEVNLIGNQSFEDPVVTNGAKWDVFPSVSEWSIGWMNPSGAPATPVLELHRGVLGAASHLEQYTELDGDYFGPSNPGQGGSTKIWQDIPTIPGKDYELKFAFSPRPNTSLSDNVLGVIWGGSDVAGTPISEAGIGTMNWSDKTFTLTATSSLTRIQFEDRGTQNGLGTFLDNVRLSCQNAPVDQCTYQNEVFYSDETMIVDGNPAALAWTHEAWVSTSSPAKWVWSSYNVQNPTEDELKSFKKTFTMAGNPVASSTLSIAVDNSYKVLINGTEVASTTTEFNFGAFTDIEIAPNLLHMGENTIEVIVHNWKPDDFEGTAESNPAGFIFALYASTKACPGDEPYVPTPETLQVKIYKYLDGAQATAETANGYDFPMNATWSWTGNNGSGNYVLNESGHGGSPAYAAFTSVMTAPAMYQTYEITNNIDANSNVLPIGATCEPGKYRLLGYRTGDTFGQAQNATLSPNYPNYQSLYDDKYVIVENETCPLPEQLASVTICKWTNGEQSLPDWTLYLTKGSKIEYLPVSSTNWNGANTVSVLDSSKSYFAIASSTWANQGGANMVDPEYSTTDNWVSNIMDGYTGYGTGILELQIQNTDGFWGPYASSTHTYAQAFTPVSTGSVNFRVFDGTDGNQNQGWFGDNSGSLGVDIYEGYAGVTGENGCVTFTDVPYGTYNVGETMKTGWQNDSGLGEVVVDSSEEIFNVTNSEIVVDDQDDELVCSEGFEPNEAGTECVATENDDNGENGATYACSDGLDNDADQATDYPADTGCASATDNDETNEIVQQTTTQSEPPQSLSGGRRRGGTSGGEVLGASTGPSCGIYLNSYIKPGANNDQSEVVKLQEFLNKYMGANIPTTGFYGPISQSWVVKFQEMFASEILNPWIAVGLGNGEGTAYVYKTTKRWINIMVCPELISELPMPPLP